MALLGSLQHLGYSASLAKRCGSGVYAKVSSRSRGIATMVMAVACLDASIVVAQKYQLPGVPLTPTSSADCASFDREARRISQQVNQDHSACLTSQACKSKHQSRGTCSCGACQELHDENESLQKWVSDASRACSSNLAQFKRVQQARQSAAEAQSRQNVAEANRESLSAGNRAYESAKQTYDQAKAIGNAIVNPRDELARQTGKLLQEFASQAASNALRGPEPPHDQTYNAAHDRLKELNQ